MRKICKSWGKICKSGAFFKKSRAVIEKNLAKFDCFWFFWPKKWWISEKEFGSQNVGFNASVADDASGAREKEENY